MSDTGTNNSIVSGQTSDNPAVKPTTVKLPHSTKITYATGAISDVILSNIIFQLAAPIYNLALGVNPVLLGYALCIPRFWEAFTDPFMGNISDNTRTRFGRRRPYIFIGAVLSAIFCALMWMPPSGWSEYGLFAFFMAMSILFFTSFTIFTIPYNALGLELSRDYNERTSVMAYRTWFMNLGALVLLPWAYKLCLRPEFGHNEVEGARVVGVIFGIIVIMFGIIPAIFCKESVQGQSQSKIEITQAIRYTFGNGVFLIVCGIVLCILIGIFLVFPLMVYVNMAYICPGDKQASATMLGIYNTVYSLAGLLAIPLVSYLGRRWGKKRTLIAGISMVIFAFMASWFLFTPRHPYLQMVFGILASPGLSCVWVITASMIADVCDVDELKTGLRREGMYGAVFSWIIKVGLGGVMALNGYILNWSGFDAKLSLQSHSTANTLRILFLAVPIVFLCGACILTVIFPITQKKVLEVQALLKERDKANAV